MNDEQLKETYIDGKVVFDGKLIRVEHWNVMLPNGKTALREVVCHRGAAAIVAVTEDGKLIFVRQYRAPISRMTLEIPAGKLDTIDEDPFVCAQRELSEETGYVADNWEKLTVLDTTPGFCNEKIHIYMASGLHTGETHPDDDEFVDTVMLPVAEAVQRVMNGEICDGKTIVGIMMASKKL